MNALFWKKLEDKVVCTLCPHACVLKEGDIGNCGVRKNVEGTLLSLNYGKVIAAHIDPIEKKPLFHFLPGSKAFSIAAPGCNLHCPFCQNWQISQEFTLPDFEIEPAWVVERAKKFGTIAYTYTEPTVYYEFALETAKLARKEGIKNVWISNGYTNPEPLKRIAKYIDAANIDVKGDDEFYEWAGGTSAKPPLNTIRILNKKGVWVEATILLIPGKNDKNVSEIAKNLAEIDPEIPLHITKFHPAYKYKKPPTSLEAINKAYTEAKKWLRHVYVGNVWGDKRQNTYCECGELLIERGLETRIFLKNGRCPKCGKLIKGVWKGGI